ncbi:hypothetical protein [Paraferrimonas sp. SM1919]|uniref:fascin domain-containing protein n=1 Tax=Paraferrimonas sp. SM1919 TaxID=2662263 RepID=UPI0013D0AEC0|nr:hypothetical protein [Paraferrimonas sp. SM1919]
MSNETTISPYQLGDIYLRMDGSGVTTFMPDGGGVVNCQLDAGPWEKFNLNQNSDGTYTIESVAFPGVFLRMDGRNVNADNPTGGVVNCQFGHHQWEVFKIRVVPVTMAMSIESVAFPGVFLRMDADGCSVNSASGCGTVNCHFGAPREAPFDEFLTILPPPSPTPQ